MAFDLSALTGSMNGSGPILSSIFPNFYVEAIRSYWARRHGEALERLTKGLAEDVDDDARFSAYRLWVEILAETGDAEALQVLKFHLLRRAQNEPGERATYAALRGIIHLELDEIDGARLMARGVDHRQHNPFCLELEQRVAQRFAPTPVAEPALAQSRTPLYDFFHWRSLLTSLHMSGREEAISHVVELIRERFQGSPFPYCFEYHRCVEQGYYAGAALVAGRLNELYPDYPDYIYYESFALFEDGDYPNAMSLLKRANQLTGEQDAEIVGLMGHCHAKLSQPEEAERYLKRAASLLQAEGLPTSQIRTELGRVEEELRGDALDPAVTAAPGTRMWLIRLSPRRYHELQTSPENAIETLLRPMGSQPKPGDFCFFAAPANRFRDEGEGETWRIVAIYTVDSAPMWHPVHRYHTSLRLIQRLDEGIPVAVQSETEDDTDEQPVSLERDHPLANGVYELEMGALDVITEAARIRNEGRDEETQSLTAKVPQHGKAG